MANASLASLTVAAAMLLGGCGATGGPECVTSSDSDTIPARGAAVAWASDASQPTRLMFSLLDINGVATGGLFDVDSLAGGAFLPGIAARRPRPSTKTSPPWSTVHGPASPPTPPGSTW